MNLQLPRQAFQLQHSEHLRLSMPVRSSRTSHSRWLPQLTILTLLFSSCGLFGDPPNANTSAAQHGLNTYYRTETQTIYTGLNGSVDSTLPGQHPDAKEVVWYGVLTVPSDGEYRFQGGPQMMITVDQRLVANDAPVLLRRDQEYSFKVRYFPATGVTPHLTWSSGPLATQAIPTSALSPNTLSAASVTVPVSAPLPFDLLNASFDSLSGQAFQITWAAGLSSFQEGANPVGGPEVDSYWKAPDYTAAATTDAHSGGGALKLAPGQEYNVYSSEVDIQRAPAYFHTAGSYELSAFVKSSSGSGCLVTLLEPGLDLGGPGSANQYVRLSKNFAYTGKPTNLNILFKNTGTGTCLFDDVKITWLSDATVFDNASSNLVINSGFEQDLGVQPTWQFAPETFAQGNLTVRPGANGTGSALGFNTAVRKMVASQRILASQLAPNTKYALKAQFLAGKDDCILALRSANQRTVLTTVSALTTPVWKEFGTNYTTPAQVEDLDIELYLGTASTAATCEVDDVVFGPVGTVPDQADSPIGEVLPRVSAPAVFAGGEALFTPGTAGGTSTNLTYTWYFGDGVTQAGNVEAGGEVSHVYARPGKYRATVTVTDALSGATRTSSTDISVMPDVQNLPDTNMVRIDQPVTLDVGIPVQGLNYQWTLSDGTVLNGPKATHTFTKRGFQDINLKVFDDRAGVNLERIVLYDVDFKVNSIAPRHQVYINARDTAALATLQFSAVDQNTLTPVTYQWDFGDGTTATGPFVEHTYDTDDRYPVTLTATDSYGQTDTAAVVVLLGIQGAEVDSQDRVTKLIPLTTIAADLGGAPTALTSAALSTATDAQSENHAGVILLAGTPETHRRAARLQAQRILDGNHFIYGFPYVLPNTVAGLEVSNNAFLNRGDRLFDKVGTTSTFAGQPVPVEFKDCVEVPIGGTPPKTVTRCPSAFFHRPAFPAKFPAGVSHHLFDYLGDSGQKTELETTYATFAGLRVPHVALAVIPDSQLLDVDVKEYQFSNAGNQEFFAQVNVPESAVGLQNGQEVVTFRLPVYAVDEAGRQLPDVSGAFPARIANVTSYVKDSTMVRGRAEMLVTLPLAQFSNGTHFDLTQIDYGQPGCFQDSNILWTKAGFTLKGCQRIVATHDLPLVPPALSAQKLSAQKLGTLQNGIGVVINPSINYRESDYYLLNTFTYLNTPAGRKAVQRAMEQYDGSTVQTIISFVPFVGNTSELLFQTLQAAVGKGADPVPVVLAAVGLALDFTSGGLDDITVPIKAAYKLTGPVGREAIKGVIDDIVKRGLKPTEALTVLRDSFSFLAKIGVKGVIHHKDAIVDALKLAREGSTTALEAIKSYNFSFNKFRDLLGADYNLLNLIKVAKYGMFAPETAKAMGKCGSECISVVGKYADTISRTNGLSKASVIQSLNEVSSSIKDIPIQNVFKVKIAVIAKSGCVRGIIKALVLDSCGSLVKRADGIFDATPKSTNMEKFKRLNVLDPDVKKIKPAEAAAAAQMEEIMGGTLDRVVASGKSADFRFIDGPYTGKSLDLMYTTDELSDSSIEYLNADYRLSPNKKVLNIVNHLKKSDYVVMDTRLLTEENTRLLLGYINRAVSEANWGLAAEDIARIIFIK
jgi:PKD repeat protein